MIDPFNRIVDSVHLPGVSPGYNHEVRVLPHLDRNPDFSGHVPGRYDFFLLEMAATLGCHLILEQDPRSPGRLECLHGSSHVVQVSVAGSAITGIETRPAILRTASAISLIVRKFRSGSPNWDALVPKPPMNTESNPDCSTINAVKTSCAPRLRITPGALTSERNWDRADIMMTLIFPASAGLVPVTCDVQAFHPAHVAD